MNRKQREELESLAKVEALRELLDSNGIRHDKLNRDTRKIPVTFVKPNDAGMKLVNDILTAVEGLGYRDSLCLTKSGIIRQWSPGGYAIVKSNRRLSISFLIGKGRFGFFRIEFTASASIVEEGKLTYRQLCSWFKRGLPIKEDGIENSKIEWTGCDRFRPSARLKKYEWDDETKRIIIVIKEADEFGEIHP